MFQARRLGFRRNTIGQSRDGIDVATAVEIASTGGGRGTANPKAAALLQRRRHTRQEIELAQN